MELVCAENTLVYDPELCVGCGTCSEVCPHGVFSAPELLTPTDTFKRAQLVRAEACMECGACALNCLVEAIHVESGVGCAAAMIQSALTGREVSCGGPGCCGSASSDADACCGEATSSEKACCDESAASSKGDSCCSEPAVSPRGASCCGEPAASSKGDSCCSSSAKPAASHSDCCSSGKKQKTTRGCC